MPDIVIAAAEPSGDMLAARLMDEVRQSRPDVNFFGIGGAKMRAAGLGDFLDNAPLSVMGYADVIGKLPRILSLRAKLAGIIRQKKPAMFVGVDAPDFNLAIAAKARRMGVLTIQYGSPSIWMWRRRRIDTIAKAVNHVWCLFPFESAYYKDAPVSASFVGHPLATMAQPNRESVRDKLGIKDNAEVIAILPGSREMELRYHLPLMAEVINLLKHGNKSRIFVAAAAGDKSQMQKAMPECIMADNAADALVAADIAVVKSGTIALEAAVVGTPMVTFYRPSKIAQRAAQWRRFYLPFFTLPNILAGRFVVPEMIGAEEATAKAIAAEVVKLSASEQRRAQMRAEFAILRQSLTSDNSAAAEVLAMLPKAG